MTGFEKFKEENPLLFERAGLALSATECICGMKRLGVSRKLLRKRVKWSKKKLNRVLDGDRITTKQMCQLTLALNHRIEIIARPNVPGAVPVDVTAFPAEHQGFATIQKTLNLIKMLHENPQNNAEGEKVVLAPSTYAQLVQTIDEVASLRLEIKKNTTDDSDDWRNPCHPL